MKIINKRAFHDYLISDRIEAGIKLTGPEVKSVKGGRIILEKAYVKIIGSEIYLVNGSIPLYPFARVENYESNRTRKLLLNKKEIIALKSKIERSSLTIIPLKCYTKHGLIKLEIGLGKGKKKKDRREELKKKAIQREVEQALRGKS